MKKLLVAVGFLFIAGWVNAQIKNPVKWSYAAKQLNAGTYEVKLTAVLEPGWHIYSQTTPDGGPVPTAFSFVKNPLLVIDGKVKENGKLEQHQEPLFGVEVKQFSNKVEFVQLVKLKGKAKTALSGTVEFMSCNNRECLPPQTEKFSIALK